MKTPLRIFIADDHTLFRQGLKSLLKLQSDVTVVGEAERLEGLASVLTQIKCDVLLLDLRMEHSSLREIGTLAKLVCVVVVTANENPEDALEAMRCGAHAVVFKRFAVDTLMDAIRAAARGDVWMPPDVQSRAVEALRQSVRDPLTPREREIIRHVALGLRNAEVAHTLHISEQTVKTHLNNIFQKLGVRDRVELALYAARVGIVGIDERS